MNIGVKWKDVWLEREKWSLTADSRGETTRNLINGYYETEM
jgi:hypothetical protein